MAKYQIVCVWANPETKELRKDVVYADNHVEAFDKSDLNKGFRKSGYVEWQALGRPAWSQAAHSNIWKNTSWRPAKVWRIHGLQMTTDDGLYNVEVRGLESGELPF